MYYKLDNLPENIDLLEPGTNLIWNFAELKAPVVHAFRYQSSSEGIYSHLFDQTEIMLKDPWGLEKYYRVTQNSARLMAEVIPVKEVDGSPLIKIYEQPMQVWTSDRAQEGTQISNGRWYIELNEWQLNKLDINGYELVRIDADEEIIEVVDATGTLYLPESRNEVRRMERKKNSLLTVRGKKGDSWVDLEPALLEKIPLDIELESTEYVFINPDQNEVIAQVAVRDGETISVLYKAREENSRIYTHSSDPDFILYPSTSFGQVRLDFVNFQSGEYTLEVFNIIGRKIWSSDYYVENNRTLKEDLSFLPKGTYLYSLFDRDRNKLYTRRIAIIKP